MRRDSGPVSEQIQGIVWIVMLFGREKRNNKTNELNEIGELLVPGALDRTDQIRKAGVIVSAKLGPENPAQNQTKSKCSSVFSVWAGLVRFVGASWPALWPHWPPGAPNQGLQNNLSGRDLEPPVSSKGAFRSLLWNADGHILTAHSEPRS